MVETSQKSSSESGSGNATPQHNGRKEIKILMLHGYTQSGARFHAKTRALEKLLQKFLVPHGLSPTLVYPTAPIRLYLRDVPGSLLPSLGATDDEDSDAWAWYRKDEATGAYRFLEAGMRAVAAEMEAHGPFDGVVGFSQGACMAAMLTAMLETGRSPPVTPTSSFETAAGAGGGGSGGETSYLEAIPALLAANGNRPLRFAVVYSGFPAPSPELAWLYEPHIATPTLHVIGSLDTLVEEGRSRELVARCEDPVVVVHPGGHYVPVAKEWVVPLVGFIQKCYKRGRDIGTGTGSSDEGS